MPYVPLSDEELEKQLRMGGGSTDVKDYVDPVTQPGFRVKTGAELPSYTRESRLAEENRLAGEYLRAGNSGRTWTTAGSETLGAFVAGPVQGLATLASIPVDTAASVMGYGRPVSRFLVDTEYQRQQANEFPVAGFLRNVLSSVVNSVGGALAVSPMPAAGVAVANAIPVGFQEYERGLDAGLTPKQALARSAAYAVVAGGVSPLIERFAPGITAGIASGFAKALADDVGKPLASAMFQRMARTGASEGAEEAVQEISNQFIDAATADLTKNKDIEKPYATYSERMLDVAKAFGLGVAGGTLVQGGFDLMARMPSTARFMQENAAQLNQPIPPQPAQPTPEAMPQPDVANMPPVPIPGQETPNVPQAPSETLPVQPPSEVPEAPVAAGPRPPLAMDPETIPQFIQDFTNSLTPEQQDALGAASNATEGVWSKSQIAKALGVSPKSLPEFLDDFDNRDVFQGAVAYVRDPATAAYVNARRTQTGAAQQPAGPVENAPSPVMPDIQADPTVPPEVKVAAGTIRPFLDGLAPETKQVIAELPVTSRKEFAAALGVEPNQLPDAVKTDRGRRAAQVMAQRDLQQQQQPPATEQSFATPGPNSPYQPTGGEVPASRSVPRPTNPNMTGPDSNETTTIQRVVDSLAEFARALTGIRTVVSEGVRQTPGYIDYGFFNPRSGRVRVVDRNSAPVHAHELSHMIDHTTSIYELAPAAATAEMRQVGAGMGGNYTPAQYISEGRAEFLRMYLQEGPQAAQQMAPEMYAHFTTQMQQRSPAALRALNKAATDYGTFIRGMNARQRVESQIVQPDDVQTTIQRTIANSTGIVNKAVGNFWDIAEVGRRMANAMRQWTRLTTGRERELPPERNPAMVMDYLHGLAATRGKEMVLDGMVDASGERTGQMSLRQVLEPLGGDATTIDQFGQYLIAKRTVAIGDGRYLGQINARMTQLLGDQWVPLTPRSGPVSLADAQATVRMLEQQYPQFRQVAADYYQFHQNVLAYMAGTSQTLQRVVDWVLLRDPGYYTPMLRDIASDGRPNSVASAQSGQIGRRLTGSNRAVIEPLTQAVQIVEARLATAHQRRLLESIIELANTAGANSFGMAQFIERLRPGEKADGHVIEVVNAQGATDRYQINDPGVTLMLSALNPVSLSSIPVFGKGLEMIFGKPSAILKTFATGINPRFALVTQPLFNVWELMAKGAAFTDRYDSRSASNVLTASVRRMANHGQLIGDWLKFWLARTIQQTGRAMGSEINGETWRDVPFLGQAMQWLDRAKQEGVEFSRSIRNDDSAAYDVSREAAGVTNSAVFRNPVRIVREDGATGLLRWMFSSIPGWVGDTLNASEYAAKAAVLKSFLEAQGLTIDSRLSERQKILAARATKESFGNYARRGATSRYLEKLSPYLTAPQVHGRSLLEAVRQDPANVMQVGMYLLIGSFLLTLKNLEDDEYREADPAQKARYVHLKGQDGGWYLLPGYSDFMTVFHGAGVILAHLYDGTDASGQVKETLKTLSSQIVPMPSPVIPMEAISQITGKDIRTGRDIVPNYKDRRDGDAQATVVSKRPAVEQYTEKTSRIARGIGWATGMSPMRIEHALDTLTARFVTDIEKVFTGDRTAGSIVAPRYREQGLLSAKDQATTDLYTEIQKANERKNDPREAETPEHREQRLMLESADSARDAYSALMRREKDQEKVNAYSRIQRGLSRLAVTMYRKGEYSHSPFKVAKRVADVEAARLDQEPAEMAKLVYNGLDGMTRKRPLRASENKTMKETLESWQADRDEAMAFKDALGMSRDEALAAVKSHMIATKTPPKVMAYRMAAIAAAYK